MFQQVLLDGSVRANRSWSVAASLASECALVGLAVLIPLLNPDLLPRVLLGAMPVVAPPLAPAPPTASAVAPSASRAVARAWDGVRLFEPRAIPPQARIFIDEPGAAPSSGVPYGLPNGGGGSSEGVIGSLVAQVANAFAPPPALAASLAAEPKAEIPRLAIGGNVQHGMLVREVIPVYPPLARQARVEGTVAFRAVIAPTGAVENLQLIGGHPMLVQAAAEAVRKWLYRPTLLNGVPCRVDTVIEVRFKLNR
jgi:periplasmic protein TonB